MRRRSPMKRNAAGFVLLSFGFLVSLTIIPACSMAEGGKMTTTSSGLKYVDEKVGTGVEATAGKRVSVHYTGWLNDNGNKGSKFDSSVDGGKPFVFSLGAGMV